MTSELGSGGLLAHHADTVWLVHQVVQRQFHQLPCGALDRLQDDVAALPAGACGQPSAASIVSIRFSQGNKAGNPAPSRSAGEFSSCPVRPVETCTSTVRIGGSTTVLAEGADLLAVDDDGRVGELKRSGDASLVGTVMAPCLAQSAIKLPDYLGTARATARP